MIESKRIGSLGFSKASYLCEEPEYPAYHIDMWYDNDYYGREKEFPEDPIDSNFRVHPEIPNFRIHKSCFKHKETSFAIAAFEYDAHEDYYRIEFIGNRPLEYLNTPELRETFWELLTYGEKQLNKPEVDND
jgi:hypothetical protein